MISKKSLKLIWILNKIKIFLSLFKKYAKVSLIESLLITKGGHLLAETE